MIKRTHRVRAWGLVAVLAATTLAACGGDDDDATDADEPAAADDTTAPEESDDTTAPEESEDTTAPEESDESAAESGDVTKMDAMFLGTTQDEAILDIIDAEIEAFNADNEFNAEISYESFANEDYKTRLATLMAADDAPDIFFTWSAGFLQPYVEGGRVYEIGQLLEADEEWMGRYNDGVFGPVTFDGGIYAVPHGQTVAVMFYNTRLFEENGVAVPTNYDELVTAVDAFAETDIIPIALPGADAWVAGQFMQQLDNTVGGIELFDNTVAGTVPWDDPAYVEGGDRFADLVDRGAFPEGFLGLSYDEGRLMFGLEEAAMFYMGSWEISALSDPELPVSEYVDVFNFSGDDGNVALGDVDMSFAISASAEDPEAAAAFIKGFSDTESQEAFAYNANYLIPTKTPLDEAQLSPLFLAVLDAQQGFTGVTPWFDRVFGAGEGTEFNNAAVAIAGGTPAADQMATLQQYAETNADG